MLKVSEKNGTMVRSGVVLAAGAMCLVEKLHAVSEAVMEKGNMDITETKYDVWVGIALHVKWNKVEMYSELKIPVEGNSLFWRSSKFQMMVNAWAGED